MSINKIRFGNSIIQYSLVKTKRVKTSQIEVDYDGVTVTTPHYKKNSEIRKMVKEKSKWIFKKQLEFKERKKQQSKSLYKTTLPYLGNEIPLSIKTGQQEDKIHFNHKHFLINLKKQYSKIKIRKLFEDWVFEQSSKLLPRRTSTISKKIGIKPSKIIVKRLRNRWGSATKKGEVNLNSNLLSAPKAVIDYIIIHELCHLKIQDHSFRYWNLVRKFVPNFEEKKRWLELNKKME